MLTVVLGASIWLAGDAIPIGNVLIPPLEHRFKRAEIGEPATLTGVIALGGGAERIREAGRLARRYPHLHVLVSGAGEAPHVHALLGEGLDSGKVHIENVSRNTHENALLAARLTSPGPGERWLLITSAAHMPRAMGAFRQAGLSVEPWPVFDLEGRTLLPIQIAQHEWLGLIGYWAFGRSSALFPAPTELSPPEPRS